MQLYVDESITNFRRDYLKIQKLLQGIESQHGCAAGLRLIRRVDNIEKWVRGVLVEGDKGVEADRSNVDVDDRVVSDSFEYFLRFFKAFSVKMEAARSSGSKIRKRKKFKKHKKICSEFLNEVRFGFNDGSLKFPISWIGLKL